MNHDGDGSTQVPVLAKPRYRPQKLCSAYRDDK